MKALITDTVPCTLDDLLAALAEVDERRFLTDLSTISARLEMERVDGPIFNQLAAAQLAKAFIESAPKSKGAQHSYAMDILFRMANGLPSRPNGVLTPTELTSNNNRMLVRTLVQNEVYLGPLKPALGRAEILLSQLLPQVLQGRPDPRDCFPSALGATYDELRDLFLGMYAWFAVRERSEEAHLTQRAFSTTADPDRNWMLVNAFAGTRDELYQRRLNYKGYHYPNEYDFQYAHSVLRDRPLVRLATGELIAPIPRHFGLAFSMGIFDFLVRHFEAVGGRALNVFDEVFGAVLETYVERRFIRELGNGRYLRLPELGNGKLSPDGISGEGDCLFELKSRRLKRGITTTGEIVAAPGYIGGKRGLGKAVAQMLSEIKRTRSGSGRGLSVDHLDDIVLCLVTPDGFPGFHMEPIRKWVVREFAKVIHGEFPDVVCEIGALQRFEWLSLDELDRLARAARADSCSVARLLRRYALERPDKPISSDGTFYPDLRDWLYRRCPASNDDPWFDEATSSAWRECSKRLLGTSEGIE